MEMVDQTRLLLGNFLTERRATMTRPARKFLEGLLCDDLLLARMRFCRWDERRYLHNSVLITTEGGAVWAVMLGHDPDAGQSARGRAALALDGLDLSPDQVLERLRQVPLWFLAIDAGYAAPPAGEAARADRTAYQLSRMPAESMRRKALLDQIDAALEAGDVAVCARLRTSLGG